jgi:colicin import membrane protein
LPSKSQDPSKKKEGFTAAEAAELAEAMAKKAKAAAEEIADKEYEAAKAAAVAAVQASEAFTNKRNQERIFRREMGEPEFFHTKADLVPARPVLSEEEQEEISRMAEVPRDQTPPYEPEHILSPEFGGTSNYESGINQLVEETAQKLGALKASPDATPYEIARAEQDLKYLDSLYQNYYFGMNVFRTAKGGRDKIKE